MKSTITHIIFDVDGTLIEESGRLDAQASAVAWKFGETIEEKQRVIDAFFATNDKAQKLKDDGQPEYKGNIPWYMKQIGEILGIEVSNEESEKMAEVWSGAYADSHEDPVLFDDTVACLDSLTEQGIELIVASGNTTETRKQLLEGVGIDNYFSQIFAATDVGFQKQDIRFWEALLKEIDVAPENIAVVGNQINDDIMHPQALGMTTIFVDRKDTLRKNIGPQNIQADYVLSDLKDLNSIIFS